MWPSPGDLPEYSGPGVLAWLSVFLGTQIGEWHSRGWCRCHSTESKLVRTVIKSFFPLVAGMLFFNQVIACWDRDVGHFARSTTSLLPGQNPYGEKTHFGTRHSHRPVAPGGAGLRWPRLGAPVAWVRCFPVICFYSDAFWVRDKAPARPNPLYHDLRAMAKYQTIYNSSVLDCRARGSLLATVTFLGIEVGGRPGVVRGGER